VLTGAPFTNRKVAPLDVALIGTLPSVAPIASFRNPSRLPFACTEELM
jgi:hypothetical protein